MCVRVCARVSEREFLSARVRERERAKALEKENERESEQKRTLDVENAQGRKFSKKRKSSATFRFTHLLRDVKRLKGTIETKSSVQPYVDGIELGHNRINRFSTQLLVTGNGTMDVENAQGQRIGDKITLQYLQVKGMMESNERYSDVSIKIMVIKSAKGDVPDDSNIWQGASANKMLDTFNTERFTFLKTQVMKIKAPNGEINPSGAQTIGSGFAQGTPIISRATKMFSMNIPGIFFGRNGVVQYENGSGLKFFDYHLVFFAYSNFSTSDVLDST